MRRFGGAVLLAVVTAMCSCGSKGGPTTAQPTVALMDGFNFGPAPDPSQGMQFITPIVTDVEPGQSLEYCTWTDVILTQDTWVTASQGWQTTGGHHIIVYYSMEHEQPGTHICQNAEMEEFEFSMPAGPTGATFDLPGNLAVKLPAGAQIVVNHHYLNAGATAIPQAQSAINILFAAPGAATTPSGSTVVLDTSMTVPPGGSKYMVDCTINHTYNVWMQTPHMHQWGSHVLVTDTTATGTQTLFDLDWDPSYAFDPSAIEVHNDPSSPFVLNEGDKIHIECDYLNTTGQTLSFGDEMCVYVTFTVDSTNLGDLDCDKGQWGSF
jgi:hypothetical protein